MKAVAENGYALSDASDELRGDTEIMEAALARASAQEAAPVGLKARLNPACRLSSKRGGKGPAISATFCDSAHCPQCSQWITGRLSHFSLCLPRI